MEKEFRQSFTFAQIKLFKNYSNLDRKTIIYGSDENTGKGFLDDDSDPFDDTPQLSRKLVISGEVDINKSNYIYNLNLYKKDNAHFFHSQNPDSYFTHHGRGGEKIPIQSVSLVSAKVIKSGEKEYFETTKDRHIRRYYNHPFASIEITNIDKSIRRDGDKVTIKYFTQIKKRGVNSKFFKKSQHSTTITFDMVKGNFLVVKYGKGAKPGYRKVKPHKSFFSNSFLSLEHALPMILNTHVHQPSKRSKMYEPYLEVFNEQEFNNAVPKFFDSDGMTFRHGSFDKDFIDFWMGKFIELKKIKQPDDGLNLLKFYYPTEVFLKKNKRKLVASILDRLGILSKVTVKILHQNPNIDLAILTRLCNLMGDEYPKYLGNLNSKIFVRTGSTTTWGSGQTLGFKSLINEIRSQRIPTITNVERENIIHIMNDVATIVSPPTHGILGYFYDHFGMMERLRKYYPDLALNTKKWSTFNDEHSRLSALERTIRKGYSIHLIFERDLFFEIEEVIETFENNEPPIMYLPDPQDRRAYEKMVQNFSPSYIKRIYTPKILKTSEDYNDEGAHQHHCVGGYINHSNSIIISLRCGDERVTCEYNPGNRKRYQARAVNNSNPPVHFKKALEELDNRIKRTRAPLAPIDKRRVPLLVNGKPIIPDDIGGHINGFDDDFFIPVRGVGGGAPVIDMGIDENVRNEGMRNMNAGIVMNPGRGIDLCFDDLA